MVRRKQPSLLLHLSRVVDSNFRDDPSVLLSPESTTHSKQQKKAWISAGTLPLLRIGDIWRAGRLEARPDYQLESFSDLQIDQATTHLVKAGLNLDDQGFLLPIAEHPWHMQCTHSYCVMVDLPGNRRLIIPCIELIRFYFGSSSGLITKLFLPPLERKALYNNPQFDKPTGRLVLELADRISGSSAADIGRLHMDPIAWRAALHIGSSALQASLSKQNVYPQAFFPFEGKTTLIAAGKWLSFGEQSQSTFIVYNLRSCSRPFPFHSLRYKSKGNHPDQAQGGQPRSSQSSAHPRQSARDAREQHLVEQDASNTLASKTKHIRSEPRFPDLQKKPIWKSKTLSTENQASLATATTPIAQSSVGESGSEQRIRSMSLAIQSQSDRSPVPEFLQDAVEQLLQLQSIHVELLTESEEDGWTVPVTMLSNEDGEVDLNLCIAETADYLRLRRTAVFSLKRENEHVSIVFIEASPVHIKVYPTTGNDPAEIWHTLKCASNDFIYRRESAYINVTDLITWVFDIS
jgi:hypothetical protein